MQASAVIGFFPANSVDEDIEVYSDESRRRVAWRLHHLRQQKPKPAGQPHYALADFVAPRDSGVADWVGAFAVTAGIGLDEQGPRIRGPPRRLRRDHAEGAGRSPGGGAGRTHARARAARVLGLRARGAVRRRSTWCAREYRGIRPAPGYPACPDHTEKATLWRMLDVERNAGIRLTENPSRCTRRRR